MSVIVDKVNALAAAIGAVLKPLTDGSNADALHTHAGLIVPAEYIGLHCSDLTTAIDAVATGVQRFRMPFAGTLEDVRLSLATGTATGVFTVDINEDGVSVLGTALTVDATETTSQTATTPAVIGDGVLADDAEITIDFDDIGDGTATGCVVWLLVRPT